MTNLITIADCSLILESLEFTRSKFENYSYPSHEIRQDRLNDVRQAIQAVRRLKADLKEKTNHD